MNPIDPIRQPQRFIEQADALIRQSMAAPGSPDPFEVIDAQIEASFASVLGRMTGAPEAAPARPAPAEGEPPRAGRPAASPYAAMGMGGMVPGMVPGMMPMMPGMMPMMPGMMPGMTPMMPGMWPGARLGAEGEENPLGMTMPMMPILPPAPVKKSEAPSRAQLSAEIDGIAGEMAARYQVPEWLVKNVIRAESGGNPLATSPVGAMGLMQLMPATALEMGVMDPYNVRDNIEGGVKYLRRMLELFDGDVTKAVAAYNAGPGNVQQHGGVPPFAETQAYVRRVLG